jgi:hypothetical protein
MSGDLIREEVAVEWRQAPVRQENVTLLAFVTRRGWPSGD